MSEIGIRCDLHDHLEVACLFAYDLEVTRRNQTTIRGRAITTRTASGAEFLDLIVESETVSIPATEIATIRVLTPGARFSSLIF